jgi:hypothetical protein
VCGEDAEAAWEVLVKSFIVALLLALSAPAFAQDHMHMPKDGDLHDRFYNGWERPDMGPGFGCCHKQDCDPT